jgi:ubiquinone biosynthesis UbiH/UbiF/VisC/COQ6 family hydroxylase
VRWSLARAGRKLRIACGEEATLRVEHSDSNGAGPRVECDVLVVGAGLVGASFAAATPATGLRTVLLDAETPAEPSREGWDSRIYAVSPGSRRFLDACGAWPCIPADRIARVESMQVFGDADGAQIEFHAYDCAVPELCYIVENRELQRALAAVIAEPDGPDACFGQSPVAWALGEDSVRVDLADGRSIEARLVVGADGMNSWVREMADIEHSVRSYGQQGVVANLETELGHESIARQWFLPEGVLALLPLPGNRVSLVWSTGEVFAARLLALESAEFEREVATVCRHALGGMRLIDRPRSFPLHLLRVEEMVRPRVALLGDAAHVVHPLAGQGLNLGFQDACELTRVLRERGPQDDCGDYRLLRRFARARSEAVATMQWTTNGLQQLFATRVFGARWLRNTGLRFTNAAVPLKNVLIEHALA